MEEVTGSRLASQGQLAAQIGQAKALLQQGRDRALCSRDIILGHALDSLAKDCERLIDSVNGSAAFLLDVQ